MEINRVVEFGLDFDSSAYVVIDELNALQKVLRNPKEDLVLVAGKKFITADDLENTITLLEALAYNVVSFKEEDKIRTEVGSRFYKNFEALFPFDD